jgi:predicted choloylglycine hydrolase
MQLTFEAVSEARPGPKWKGLFRRYWPSYKAWYQSRTRSGHPSMREARAALRRYMPELVPTFEQIVELTGGNELAASFLSCYRPPPYLISCSQAVLSRPGDSVLVRNYDLDPRLNEGLILHSSWSGRSVIATSEFMWGVADGVNDAGLTLSLAFGGSRSVGDGFGMPLILRYVLEVCDDLGDAITVLRQIPSHMAYNVTLLDRRGDCATVQVGPNRAVEVIRPAIATNHQGKVQWAEHGRFTATVEREQFLRARLADSRTTDRNFVEAFLEPPLYNTDYGNGFGTLYTVVYRPDQGVAQWHWPDAVWEQSFSDFLEGRRHVHYSPSGATVAVHEAKPQAKAIGQTAPGCNRDRRRSPSCRSDVLAPVLAALRTGLTAGGFEDSPALAAWIEEAERSERIPWESLGSVYVQQCGSD